TLPGENRLADVFDPGAGITSALRDAKDLKIMGEETLNGVKVWRVEGTVDAASLSAVAPTIAEPGYATKGIAWIGQAQPLVYRVRLEGPLGSKDPANIVRIINLSKFDEDVSIDLPCC
ncbi:MAG: LppX_LprAFG lipoprotein, partial [Dehalococcoidia bacterium]